MYSWHERTQRLVCRLLFVLFCPLPAAGVLAAAAWKQTPWHAARHAAQWSEALGLNVTLDAVEEPRPGLVRVAGVRLIDPETAAVLAAAPRAEISRQGEQTVVFLPHAEIGQAHLARLAALLHQRVLQRPAAPEQIALTVGALRLAGLEEAAAPCGTLRLRTASSADSPEAVIDLDLVPPEGTPPAGRALGARIRIVRDRRNAPPATRVEIETGEREFPYPLLAQYLPGLIDLGAACRLRGSVWAMHGPDGWQGEAAGRLIDIDLDRLVTARFAHRLSGTAEAAVRHAAFRGGRLVEADGWLAAGPGWVSRSMLDAAAREMKLCRVAADDPPWESLVAYRQLAFGFAIDRRGLSITGQCLQAPAATVLLGERGPLLAQPLVQPLRPVGLVRALSPQAELLAPATPQAAAILACLPAAD